MPPVLMRMPPPSEQQYVAPTIFRKAQATSVTRWNYYKSKADAIAKSLFLLKKKGGKDVTPAGSVSFNKEGAQTLGINVDFYAPSTVLPFYWIPYTYAEIKEKSFPSGTIFRFYKTDGSGPYWACFSSYLGAAATKVGQLPPEKLAALDEFHRELQVLKAKHNALVEYLGNLTKKHSLSPAEQQSFNRGKLLLDNMRLQIGQIKGVDIVFAPSGSIGEPISLTTLIIIIAISSLLIAGATYLIVAEVQKTKRLNASYDMQKWIHNEKLEIAKAEKEGKISPEQAKRLQNDLDKAANSAAADANNITSEKSFFGEMSSLFKWGLIAFVGIKAIDTFSSSSRSKR